jgi:hypothetical protein
MIRFKTFILPKINCGISRMNDPAKIEEKIELASDVEHAETEHGVDPDQLVTHIKQQSEKLPHQKEPQMPWYAHDAKPTDIESLRHKNLDQHSAQLEKHYSGWGEHHIKTIQSYTSGQFRTVNSRILGGMTNHIDEAHMSIMDSALHHHSTPEPMTVYSGVSSEHAQDILHSEKVHHPAYLSTSISYHTASAFAKDTHFKKSERHKHVLAIHVPQGHPGGYIEHHTSIPMEHEFILPRDTVLHINHSKRQMVSEDTPWGKFHTYIHHATPVKE